MHRYYVCYYSDGETSLTQTKAEASIEEWPLKDCLNMPVVDRSFHCDDVMNILQTKNDYCSMRIVTHTRTHFSV